MKHKPIFLTVYTALFAALIFVATFTLKVPTPVGYVHLGDGFIFIASAILPLPYALAAAAVGAGLSDLVGGYAAWIATTIIIKCICALCFTNKKKKFFCARNVIALGLATVVTVVGYYLFGVIVAGNNFIAPLAEIPFNAVQSAAGIVIYCVFGLFFDNNKSVRNFLTRITG